MTNSEKIRHLTNEELAEFLRGIERYPDGPWWDTFHEGVCVKCLYHNDCDNCEEDEILWWLKQEVSENDEDGH